MNKQSLHNGVLIASRILVGMIFLVSGLFKITDIRQFQNTIAGYGFEQWSDLAPVIVIFEVALAMLLILGVYARIASFVSVVTIVIFTIIFTYGYLAHSVVDCGCFGTLGDMLSPVWFYIRNLILLGLSWYLFNHIPHTEVVAPYKVQILFFVLLITAYSVGFMSGRPIRLDGRKSDVLNFEGKNIFETPLGKYAPIKKDSVYMLYFFSYNCPHCLNSMENIKQYTASGFVSNVILVGTGEQTDQKWFYSSFNIDFSRHHIVQSEMDSITHQFPVAYFIINDTIRRRWVGTLPAHQNLRKQQFLKYKF